MTQEQLLNVPGLQAVLVETRVRDLLDTAEPASPPANTFTWTNRLARPCRSSSESWSLLPNRS